MMKKILAAAAVAALVGAVGAANAADLYKGSTKEAPVYVPPPPTWTGFYVGVHVGGFWADINNHDLDGYNYNASKGYGWNNNNDGVFGGGTVGYNYQTGAFVLGVEADFGAAGLTGSWNNGLVGYHRNLWAENDGSFYADVTGRLGYAAGPALLYVKGGWAYLDSNLQVGGVDYLGIPWSVNSGSLDGWTVGGGIEYLWSPKWSVKAEYQYFDFGTNNTNWAENNPRALGTTWRFDQDLTVSSLKVGLNYHINNNVYAPLK